VIERDRIPLNQAETEAGYRRIERLITRRSQVRILPPLPLETPANVGVSSLWRYPRWRTFCPPFAHASTLLAGRRLARYPGGRS
jgi:hypothetical protein